MCYHDLRALNTIIIIIRRSSGNINIGIIFFYKFEHEQARCDLFYLFFI